MKTLEFLHLVLMQEQMSLEAEVFETLCILHPWRLSDRLLSQTEQSAQLPILTLF